MSIKSSQTRIIWSYFAVWMLWIVFTRYNFFYRVIKTEGFGVSKLIFNEIEGQYLFLSLLGPVGENLFWLHMKSNFNGTQFHWTQSRTRVKQKPSSILFIIMLVVSIIWILRAASVFFFRLFQQNCYLPNTTSGTRIKLGFCQRTKSCIWRLRR